MENDVMSGEQEKEPREELTLPLIILSALIFAWFANVYENRNWIVALQQIGSWLTNPVIYYTSIQVKGVLHALLATIEILILGTVSSHVLLANEKDKFIKRISALGLGVGFIALITIILGILGKLYQLPLNIVILVLIASFLSLSLYKHRGREQRPVWGLLKDHFSMWKFGKPINFKIRCRIIWLLPIIAISSIFLFVYYHGLLTPILHWDATVYHATMAKIMYRNHGIPLIAGHSVGIQMSANYPPLFPAVGAYYYIQIGAIEDFYLRAVAPTMGLLTILATYKIGKILTGERGGKIAAILLSMSPLFILHSIYALNYTMLTFFITISVLFLFLAITERNTAYWVMCGVFYGFAMLTSLQAFYFLPFFATAIAYLCIKKGERKLLFKSILSSIMSAVIISGAWYLRNIILLGDPIYPLGYTIFSGKYIDPIMLETTLKGIYFCSLDNFFGKLNPTVLERIGFFIFNNSHFPVISILLILGVALATVSKNKRLWMVCLAWSLIPSVLILSGITNIFPRYFVLTLPGFALISSLPIVKAFEKCYEYSSTTLHNKRVSAASRFLHKGYLIKACIILVIILMLIFPTSLATFGGKMYRPEKWLDPFDDHLRLFIYPGQDARLVLERFYGGSVEAWGWLNEHLKEGEKVATFENKIYYIKDGENEHFFYLDGWEARDLRRIDDPSKIIQHLSISNVKYILDPWWIHDWDAYQELPLTRFLRSPYFPVIFEAPGAIICNVGPTDDPITAGSLVPISISIKGWTDLQVANGREAKSVIAEDSSPRLYVATPGLTIVRITYLDRGTQRLGMNLYNQYKNEWIMDYTTIMKHNTNEWKTYEFLAPISERGFVEFGLHAYHENFTISKIEAVPLQLPGKVSLYSLEGEITNMTHPPTLMVYLPILRGGEKITVQTNSYVKNISIEVFEGVIQPWETTKWWERHKMAARSPELPTWGEKNPSLSWEAKPGIYTLVIVLWDEYEPDTKVDFSMAIGGGR